jgi:uncharacterized protein YjbI with pentapeptide repeats
VIRDTTVLLPADEADLDVIADLPRDGATVSDRLVSGDTWARGMLTKVTITGSRLTDADLTSLRTTDVKWERCVLRGCTLVGANIAGGTFQDVLFADCRLDQAALDHVRATGPVAFAGCAMTETTFIHCGLNGAVFDGCKLASTRFDSTDLRDADLRGNDLSTVAGLPSLRGAVIEEPQLPGLTHALIRELALTVTG